MAMRSVTTLNLQVGPLIGIPVRVYKAEDEPKSGVEFKQVHAACGKPVNRPSVCRTCEREIQFSEIKKAYPLTDTQHIIIEESEIKALRPERDGQIGVEAYVNPEDIQPTYFAGPAYRLMPATKDTAAFCTFREALDGRYALAKVVLYGRERVVAIRAEGRALAMFYMRSKAEVRNAAEMPGYDEVPLFVRPEYVAMMKQLIDAHDDVSFDDVTITKDRYFAALQRLVAEKVSGLTPNVTVPDEPQAPPTSGSDIMARLQASLDARKVA